MFLRELRKQLVKQILIPCINRRLKKLTNMLNLAKPQGHASCLDVMSYPFPINQTCSSCSQSFIFSQCFLLNLPSEDFWLVAVEWRAILELQRKKKNQLLNVGFIHLITTGSLPRVGHRCGQIACANLCFRFTALGRRQVRSDAYLPHPVHRED